MEELIVLKGPIKAVSGHKIAPNRFKTTYRSVLTFEEKKQSITHLFMHKTFHNWVDFQRSFANKNYLSRPFKLHVYPLSSMFTFT